MSGRGFAALDADTMKQIAGAGGRAAHAKGTAHEWTADEARAAGRQGGLRVSQDRERMRELGRRGGLARGKRAAERAAAARQAIEEQIAKPAPDAPSDYFTDPKAIPAGGK